MARGQKKETLTPEERLQAALVPEIEQPYSVPGNWCWTFLKPISKIRTGKKDANYGSVNGEYPFFTCAAEPIRCHGYSFDCNAILLAGNGDINNISRYNGKFEAYQRTYVVEIIEPINIDYVFYWFKYRWFDFNKDKMFGTAIPYIRLGNLQEIPIPVPPLAQQQRIVDRIESLFAKLDEAKQKAQDALDSFETRKAAILHKAFTGELTAQWRKEHGVGMESWETHELVECFEIVSGIQKTPARSPKDNPVPYLAVANVYRDKIDLSDIRYFEVTPEELEKLKLQDKDILIVEGNGSGNEIGRCAMWHNELPLCIHQNHIIRMRNKTADVLPEYVLYYLNSQAGKSVMQERAKTTAGLFNLSAGKVKTIPLPFASLDEQIEIVRILDDLLVKEQQAKEAAEGVLEQIDLIKKAILARAFRGELGTNDPSEESVVELLKQALKADKSKSSQV